MATSRTRESQACGWVRSKRVIAEPPIAIVISLASYRQQQSMRRWSFRHIPVHDEAPACDKYSPAAQPVHLMEFSTENLPAAQPVHLMEFSTENLPAAQVSQSAALEESENLPASQLVQMTAFPLSVCKCELSFDKQTNRNLPFANQPGTLQLAQPIVSYELLRATQQSCLSRWPSTLRQVRQRQEW